MYTVKSEHFLFSQLGEEGVIFDINKNEYFSLNETYTKIYLGAQNGLLLEQIVALLVNEYSIDEITCFSEVEIALNKLLANGYLEKQNS